MSNHAASTVTMMNSLFSDKLASPSEALWPLFLAGSPFFLSSACFALHPAGLAVSDGLPIRFCMPFAYRSTISSSATSLRIAWAPQEFPVATFPFHEREKRVMEALAARLALARGEFELAQRWEATCGLGPLDPLPPALSSSSYLEYETLACILIARGRRERTGAALSQALLLCSGYSNEGGAAVQASRKNVPSGVTGSSQVRKL